MIVPFHARIRAASPSLRPAYQGSNPISDIWSRYAIEQSAKYLLRAVADPSDMEARENMCMASTAAGTVLVRIILHFILF